MAFSLEASTASGTITTVTDCLVNVFGHVQTNRLTSHGVIHATLARVSRQVGVMGEIK